MTIGTGGSADGLARLGEMTATRLLSRPGFTLRGGTNEILRGCDRAGTGAQVMSEVARRSHWWRRTILSFVSGALSVILLLVVAYFGIRKFDTGGRLPERQAKTEAELAARFAADMKDAADKNRADIAHHVQTLYARQRERAPTDDACCSFKPPTSTWVLLARSMRWPPPARRSRQVTHSS